MGTADEMAETEVKDATPVGDSDVPSELEAKIIRQIEYYFGNYNLPRDKFLMQQTKLDDGWVPLETMVKFNRLKILSTDFKVITDALKKSPSDLMEVSEDGQKIRRRPEKEIPEYTQVVKDELVARSLYVKGFPISITLDQLLEFFKEKANVENIQMRRNPNTRTFKGSVFATFYSKEAAEDFMKTQTKLKYKDRVLSIETKADYMKRKEDEHQQRLAEKLKKAGNKNAGDAKGENSEKGEGQEEKELNYPKGCLLKLTGLSENTTWEDIKEVFKQYGDIAFVEYSKGLTEASIRFMEGTTAAEVLEKATSGGSKTVTVCGAEVSLSVLDGEAEAKFWKKFHEARSRSRSIRNKPGQRGRGQQGGRNKKGNKRKGDKTFNEPPAKKQKDDENATAEKTDDAAEVSVPSEETSSKQDKSASETKMDTTNNGEPPAEAE